MILDLGSKTGRSSEDIKQALQDHYLISTDIRRPHLSHAKDRRVLADIRKSIVKDKSVDYVTMWHVLEHMKDLEEVRTVIKRAAMAAKKMLWIVGPWFDDDKYLADLGFNLYWSTWPGHKTHLTSQQLHDILVDLRLTNNCISGTGFTTHDSHSHRIHNIGYEAGHNYHVGKYPEKRFVKFDRSVWDLLDCKVYV